MAARAGAAQCDRTCCADKARYSYGPGLWSDCPATLDGQTGGALGVFLLEMGMTARCQGKNIARVSGFAKAAAGALVWQGL
jgi:hypothetical protein